MGLLSSGTPGGRRVAPALGESLPRLAPRYTVAKGPAGPFALDSFDAGISSARCPPAASLRRERRRACRLGGGLLRSLLGHGLSSRREISWGGAGGPAVQKRLLQRNGGARRALLPGGRRRLCSAGLVPAPHRQSAGAGSGANEV